MLLASSAAPEPKPCGYLTGLFNFVGIMTVMPMIMKKQRIPHKRTLILVIVGLVIVAAGSVGAIVYLGNQAIANQQSESHEKLTAMDRKIAEIRTKKAAEKKAKEEAERKKREAAKRKAAADAALRKQMAGQIVTPAGCAIKGAHGDPNAIDVVINKKRCFNPINFVPSDLVSFNGSLVSAKILPNLKAMLDAATKADKPLGITSSYRSYSNQVATYNHWVNVNGSTAAADKVSARPGYSEHQTGFAVDLSCAGASLEKFTSSSCHTWLTTHGAKYGFIQRYQPGFESITGYNAESWHWRYVGPTIAQEMKTKGVKTLEQLWGIEGGDY